VHEDECLTAVKSKRNLYTPDQQQLEELADILAEIFNRLTPEEQAFYLSAQPKAA
jgi:hypothetical protein